MMKKTVFALAISLLAASQAMAAGISDKVSFSGALGYMNGGDTISSFRFLTALRKPESRFRRGICGWY
jgi:hypothetical protein